MKKIAVMWTISMAALIFLGVCLCILLKGPLVGAFWSIAVYLWGMAGLNAIERR